MKTRKFIFVLILSSIIFTDNYPQDFWKPIGLAGTFIGLITQDNNGRLYAAEWVGMGDSVFFSDNGGEDWNSYGEVSDSFFINISSMIFLNNGDILVSAWEENGGIFKSTDEGKTWVRKDNGINTNGITKLIKSPDDLYAGTFDGIYLSINDGESWEKVNTDPDTIDVIDMVRTDTGLLFAIDFNKIYKSTDGGKTWSYVNLGINGFTWLTISEDKYLFLGTEGKIYRSDDWGENWVLKKSGISVRGLAVNSSGFIIAATELQGVLLSTDRGESWEQINTGLPNPPHFINSVYFDKDGYALCSIHNFGIYKSTSAVVSVEKEELPSPSSYVLYQNYPNPFNPDTKIKFFIPSNVNYESSSVILIIYDALGKKVATLVNRELPAGIYEVSFDAANLPSGVYIYKLTADSFVSSKKMLLLK